MFTVVVELPPGQNLLQNEEWVSTYDFACRVKNSVPAGGGAIFSHGALGAAGAATTMLNRPAAATRNDFMLKV